MSVRVSVADGLRVEIDRVFASGGDLAGSVERVARLGARLLLHGCRRLDEFTLDYLFLDASQFEYHVNAAAEPVPAAWGIDTEAPADQGAPGVTRSAN